MSIGNVADDKRTVKRVANHEKPIQRIRFLVQMAFALLCIWIGVEFHFFVRNIETAGALGSAYRPPGVEGFLPISSLISLFYYAKTGILPPIHPAGMFILIAIILISLLVGKSFCSWLCPVGFLSELLGDMGKKLFGRNLKPPRWLDYPLRGLKYLLLGFFLYSIIIMTTAGLRAFLDSPYNQVADVKMYYFFADISRTALIVLAVLFLLSLVIRNFWCRYLCPYGALLGITSLLSPQKIRRDPVSCIDCGKCALACPSRIKVDQVRTVISDECTGCLNCVDVCPVKDTLWLQSAPLKRRLPKALVPVLVVGGFVLITGLAMLTGHWQNNMTINDYIKQRNELKMYGHPTSLEDISRMNQQSNQTGK